MEWIYEPTAWAGLMTLVVLEIVLGIDNLIFIAILSDKLPPEQRQRARITGLSLALLMRLGLLAAISWLAGLTDTLFTVIGNEISARDLIMFVGGGFLLFKGTMELHEKLEGRHANRTGPVQYAQFWHIIIQIIILDAVFSLDAVITAVGMVEHLSVMMIAVCIAMVLMIIAANPLMNFVSNHPTVVILCLGFLLMIGFSLIVEGLGYHIPKGYLYAAIGFSVLIEAFNQTAQWNRKKVYKDLEPRARVAMAVLSLLGGKTETENTTAEAASNKDEVVFQPQERLMINRVLQLSEQSVESIMTPRRELYWIDLNDDIDTIRREVTECPFSCIIVAEDGKIEETTRFIHKKEIADLFLQGKGMEHLEQIVRRPVLVLDTMTVLQALEEFRKQRIHVGFVIDEYGTLQGLVTLTDVAEAIAGDMPEEHEAEDDSYILLGENTYRISGALAVQDLPEILEDIPTLDGDYNTVAGIALYILKKLPAQGDTFTLGAWNVEIEEMDGNRIRWMRFTRKQEPDDPSLE